MEGRAFKTPLLLSEGLFSRVVIPWWGQKIEDFAKLPSRAALLALQPEHESADERQLLLAARTWLGEAFETQTFSALAQLAHLKGFIEKALDYYSDCFFKTSRLDGVPPQLSLVEAPLDSAALGSYNQSENSITLQATPRSFGSAVQLMASLLTYRLPTRAAERGLLFLSQGDSGLVNHELEHARRGDSCGGGHSHGVNAEGKTVHFEACAASFARAARRRGAVVDLMDYLQELAVKVGINAISLLQIAEKLKEGKTGHHKRAFNDLFAALASGSLNQGAGN